ncbi:Protein of unknown function [Propionibacterium freudenreichii]|nr:Protein of unknown function [Propionibacterium freudenreichii]CEI24029.1 Protein of unknown function [Propionibacterium freudenreichii]
MRQPATLLTIDQRLRSVHLVPAPSRRPPGWTVRVGGD